MDTKTPLAARLISSILCGALLLTCPGSAAYAAIGQVVSVKVNAPVNAPAGAGLLKTSFSGTLDTRTSALTGTLSGTGLSALAAPAVKVGQSPVSSVLTAAPAASAIPVLQAPLAAAAPAERAPDALAAPPARPRRPEDVAAVRPAAPIMRQYIQLIGSTAALPIGAADTAPTPLTGKPPVVWPGR